MLTLDNVSLEFGGLKALDGVSFDVQAGAICGLIGPNGAGKTSLLNCISGLYRPTSGSIRVAGSDALSLPVHGLLGAGVARTFQHTGVFASMSVRENVELGALGQAGRRFWTSLLPARGADRAVVDDALARLGLLQVQHARAADLPYGTLKRVELARALAGRPRLLLLDEPAAGLTQSEVDALGQLIRALRDELGLTIVLVEHHMPLVMGTCDRVVVLNFGRVLAQGPPAQVRADEGVIEAYLGAPA